MPSSIGQANKLLGCDTAVVLAPHSRAGTTLLAKNSDRPGLECQPLFYASRRHYREGETVHCRYLEIPQAAETAAVIGSRPWWLWGFEHGVNEHGVAIGNEAVLTREELGPTGLRKWSIGCAIARAMTGERCSVGLSPGILSR